MGPQVGRDLQVQALYAVLAGMAGILIYVAFRFDFRGGIIAIAGAGPRRHVTLGALSLSNREMSLPVLAALLTIVGYSINDTIVVFDRIRENRGRGPRRGQTVADLINGALNQTLSRTILTSFTTFLAALVLLLFGGEVLRRLRLRPRDRRGHRDVLLGGGRLADRGLGSLERTTAGGRPRARGPRGLDPAGREGKPARKKAVARQRF